MPDKKKVRYPEYHPLETVVVSETKLFTNIYCDHVKKKPITNVQPWLFAIADHWNLNLAVMREFKIAKGIFLNSIAYN